MNIRKNKGNSLLEFTDNYTVLNVYTTDFDYFYGKIIKIHAKKYRNFKLVSEYDQLINPGEKINSFISEKTGITNKMVKRMPTIDLITHDFLRFIEGEILVGHNINFDINFLYDSFSQSNLFITNDYIDTLRLARIIVNNSPDHQLLTLIEYFNIDNDYNSTDYRSELYLELYKKNFEENSIDTYKQRKKESRKKSDFSLIASSLDLEEIDNTNPFYDKYVCITGKLDFSTKTDLCKILANLGARNQNNVTKDTDYLILGNLRHQQQMYGDKSSKHKKAEKMISEGFNIEILTELSTKELIESYE